MRSPFQRLSLCKKRRQKNWQAATPKFEEESLSLRKKYSPLKADHRNEAGGDNANGNENNKSILDVVPFPSLNNNSSRIDSSSNGAVELIEVVSKNDEEKNKRETLTVHTDLADNRDLNCFMDMVSGMN